VPTKALVRARRERGLELAASLRRAGLRLEALAGIGYDPIGGRWTLSRDLAVNYLAFAIRPARS